MIENVMVLDSYWDDEPDEDYYDEYGTEGNVIDCLMETENVHMFMEHFLRVEDLSEQEIKCQEIFDAMCKTNPNTFYKAFREWECRNDEVRDLFNEWYANR